MHKTRNTSKLVNCVIQWTHQNLQVQLVISCVFQKREWMPSYSGSPILVTPPPPSYTPRNRFFRSRRKTSPALGSISVLKGVRPLFWRWNKGLRLNPLRQTSSISPHGSWLRSLYSLILFYLFFPFFFFLSNKAWGRCGPKTLSMYDPWLRCWALWTVEAAIKLLLNFSSKDSGLQ